jgi:hypothetical protein
MAEVRMSTLKAAHPAINGTPVLAGVPGSYASLVGEYDCPHCGRRQAVHSHTVGFGAASVGITQCLSCGRVRLALQLLHLNVEGHPFVKESLWLYPPVRSRLAKTFAHCPSEILQAYGEACDLFGVHVGASGAYARRALELTLERAGYAAQSLANSIVAAGKETDADKKLPKRLRLKLDYIKEIGNFALHVRRDGELAIVEIAQEEVSACLETIEDLITYMFEEPGVEYARTVALNEKLKAAGKRPIELPDPPPT